jgi:hypothetical protein
MGPLASGLCGHPPQAAAISPGSVRLWGPRASRRGEVLTAPAGLLHHQFIFPCVSLSEFTRQERAQAQRVPSVHHHSRVVCSAAVAAPPARSNGRVANAAVVSAPPTYVKTSGRIVASATPSHSIFSSKPSCCSLAYWADAPTQEVAYISQLTTLLNVICAEQHCSTEPKANIRVAGSISQRPKLKPQPCY